MGFRGVVMIKNAKFEKMIKEFKIKMDQDGKMSFSCLTKKHSDKEFMEVQRTLPYIKEYMIKKKEAGVK